jgi:hypothetical protein
MLESDVTVLDKTCSRTGENPTLEQALMLHQTWKERLLTAVQAREPLEVDRLQRDNCCALGEWIYSIGHDKYGTSPEFIDLLKRHQEFHEVAGIVAAAINGGEFDRAQKMLGERTQFAYASIDVSVAIIKLKVAVAGK